ncbi:coadhesin-like [Ylistrum balloti]|uniref:coadhesin-like n=1 Tax=Ylistrum balloti TaxID=509963 RepID=UPI002905ACEA|nr:coadhesin-like [Ylistrum balloti]
MDLVCRGIVFLGMIRHSSWSACSSSAKVVVFSTWSNCSEECGGGRQFRHCVHNCPDEHMPEEEQDCNTQPCPTSTVDGSWSEWGSWGQCSATCGPGHHTRTRVCNNPKPQHGGQQCSGHHENTGSCNYKCPIDGGWSEWSNWSSCSASCGTGRHSRHRFCNNPVPKNGGRTCHGHASNKSSCTTSCPPVVNGAWGQWSSWSPCSVTCGTGHRTRTHVCDNPKPQNGGHQCHGHNLDRQSCTNHCETVDGAWGEWTAWSSCFGTCGKGLQTRGHVCDSPAPQHGGEICHGNHMETRTCIHDIDCTNSTVHQCDKLSVLHALAEIDTTSKVMCLDNWTTETEGFLMENCNAPHDTTNWHTGTQVLKACQNMSSHAYLPVGTFEEFHYGHHNVSGFSGIFVGCNDQHTGFKYLFLCLPLPPSYNHTSTGIIPNDPSVYHFIKWF